MKGLLTKIIFSLLPRSFCKNETEALLGGVPGLGSPTTATPRDHEEEVCREASNPRVDLDDVVRQIQVSTQTMGHLCKKVDKNFLGIGERLQDIYGQAGDLTQKASSTMAHMGTDSADNVLTRVSQTADDALEQLGQKQIHIEENLNQVVALGDHLKKLGKMSDQLKVIARFLKMVGINISIESSRTEDAVETFVALAGEIRELAVTVTQVTRSFNADIHSARTHLVATHQQMHTKLDYFQQLAKTAHDSIERTSPIVQAILTRSVDALTHVGEDAQAITQSVGNIVLSLQIHDNVSQRIEHIAEALADVKKDGPHEGAEDEPADDPNSALAATLSLQIAQLEQVVRDVEDAYQVGTRAFEEIKQTIENIAQHMTRVGGEQGSCPAITKDSSSSVEVLQSTLEEINTMIGSGNDTVQELQGITQSATTVVSKIEQHMVHVREVNFDIHLKSLNAMFKSLRLSGKGKAIQALVQEMKNVATESDTFAGQVDAIRGTIVETANVLQDKFDASIIEERQACENDSGGLGTAIQEFSAASQAFELSARESVTMSRHLGDQIDLTATELSFVKTFADDLAAQLDHLKTLCRKISPDGEIDQRHLLSNKGQIAASYTMQQERDIHHQLLNGGTDAEGDDVITSEDTATETNAEASISTDEQAQEAFDDNIELF